MPGRGARAIRIVRGATRQRTGSPRSPKPSGSCSIRTYDVSTTRPGRRRLPRHATAMIRRVVRRTLPAPGGPPLGPRRRHRRHPRPVPTPNLRVSRRAGPFRRCRRSASLTWANSARRSGVPVRSARRESYGPATCWRRTCPPRTSTCCTTWCQVAATRTRRATSIMSSSPVRPSGSSTASRGDPGGTSRCPMAACGGPRAAVGSRSTRAAPAH